VSPSTPYRGGSIEKSDSHSKFLEVLGLKINSKSIIFVNIKYLIILQYSTG
jgi:TnpA family transposase